VGAFTHLAIDQARALARRDGERLRTQPLRGLPVGLKDIYDTHDMPTEYGSAAYKGHRPASDAAPVAMLRRAGGIILGKTVTTEFAHQQTGKTRNPHNLEHTPGGSSSGSAAAVADNMVPIAFANQTAGSLIRPSSYCGICGFKPTQGTLDLRGILAMEATFDTHGYMARSFEDIVAFHEIVSRQRQDRFTGKLDHAPRIGVCRTYQWPHAEPAAVAAFEQATKEFVEL